MKAVHSPCALQFCTLLQFSKQPRLGGKPIYSVREIADGLSLCHSQKDFPKSTISNIRSDGNKRRGPPGRSSSSRGRMEDEDKTPQSSNGKKSNPSNQEEIISLFRRIQSAISKGDSASTKETNSSSPEDKPSAESILEVLRNSRKEVKGDAAKTSNKEGDNVLAKRRGVPKKVQVVQNNPPVENLRSTRPQSKFVKRSPIPSPSTLGGRIQEFNKEASQAQAGTKESKLLRIEEMKLTELKELAKSRGIRGYSKLKKNELVQLLRS